MEKKTQGVGVGIGDGEEMHWKPEDQFPKQTNTVMVVANLDAEPQQVDSGTQFDPAFLESEKKKVQAKQDGFSVIEKELGRMLGTGGEEKRQTQKS